MKKKITNKTWLFLVLLALFSCRTEETLISAPIQNQEYTNKSLWKEDEIFIKNVKRVYDDNADPTTMQSRYGEIYWDYASSMNTYNETYLIAPILKDNEVVSYVEARRIGNKVFFEFTENDEKTNDFFSTLIFTDRELLSISENHQTAEFENENEVLNQSYSTRVLQCRTIIKYLYIGEGDTNPQEVHDTVCRFVDAALPDIQPDCISQLTLYGECITGGGGGGYNYTYPNPEEEELEDDCEKVKQNLVNPRFKEKYNELDTESNLNGINEKGIFERAAPPENNLQSSFIPISNQSCTTEMDLPSNIAGIYGLFHIHNNVNCDNGKINVNAPSSEDIRTFFHILMKQAKQYKGS